MPTLTEEQARTAARFSQALKQTPIDGYDVGDVLGAGVSSVVFDAKNRGGQAVALKIYHGRFVSHVRLERELELVGHDCPNMVKIIEGGSVTLSDGACAYLVMEKVGGRDLADIVEAKEHLDDATIRRMLRELLVAVRYLKARDYCHRDIKPANIKIRADGTLVLLDLGVIQPMTESEYTGSTDFLGTFRYAPPEMIRCQVADDAVGHDAVTSYQIGGVLHDLIQGARLFGHLRDRPQVDLWDEIRDVRPQLRRSDIGRDLVRIAQRCLAKQVAERPTLDELQAVAIAPFVPPPPLADLGEMVRAAKDRYDQNVVDPKAAAEKRQQQVRSEWASADGVVRGVLALKEIPELQRFQTNGSGPGYYDALQVVSFPEDVAHRFVGELRIAVYTDILNMDAGTLRVRGMAVRGYLGNTAAHDFHSLVLWNYAQNVYEDIWRGSFDADQLREDLAAWVHAILKRYFDETASTYERRLAADAADAKRVQRPIMVREVETPEGLFFSTKNSAKLMRLEEYKGR